MHARSSRGPQRAGRGVRGWHGAWILLGLLAVFLSGSFPVRAAALFKPGMALTSRSGQFVVFAPNPTAADVDSPASLMATNLVRLEQGPLAIICDRIREVLLQEMGAANLVHGRVYVYLRPGPPTAEIILKPLRFAQGWQYELTLPTRVDRTRLVTAITHTVLQEMANRSSGGRVVNLPQWLVEGMTAQVLIAGGPALVPEPRRVLVVEMTPRDHFAAARAHLRQHGALSFSDMNLPSNAQLVGAGWETHRHSAQVFVASLLRLSGGNLALVNFTRELGNYLNPQLAFLKAFNGHFRSALEVEKWWSVTVINLTGRDQHMNWTQSIALQRLDEILHTAVQSPAAGGELARRQNLRLQDGLMQLDFSQQRQVLTQTVRQLEILQWNAPRDLSRLVLDYRKTLADYLLERGRVEMRSDLRNRIQGGPAAVIQNTIRQLDLLDVIREDFRKTGETAAALPAGKP